MCIYMDIYIHSIIIFILNYLQKFSEKEENGAGMKDCKKLHEEEEEVDILKYFFFKISMPILE